MRYRLIALALLALGAGIVATQVHAQTPQPVIKPGWYHFSKDLTGQVLRVTFELKNQRDAIYDGEVVLTSAFMDGIPFQPRFKIMTPAWTMTPQPNWGVGLSPKQTRQSYVQILFPLHHKRVIYNFVLRTRPHLGPTWSTQQALSYTVRDT